MSTTEYTRTMYLLVDDKIQTFKYFEYITSINKIFPSKIKVLRFLQQVFTMETHF